MGMFFYYNNNNNINNQDDDRIDMAEENFEEDKDPFNIRNLI